MIQIFKTRLFSKTYVVSEGGTAVAELRRSIWRSQAELGVQGRILKLQARGAIRRRYLLIEGETVVLKVTQPSGWRSRLLFEFQARQYEIANKPWYRSALIVRSDGTGIGSIRSKGFVFTHLLIDLPPDQLPLAIRVFLGWIAMVRREEAVAAG